ncbi:MAG: D-alanyl-D-alanine carboxypeptidase, partial [Firmicutes bacterium]|nr:D-alanyl-D-alanine carboxypeptidase [Bacillota bacterium]
MKRLLTVLLLCLLICAVFSGAASALTVDAGAAVLVDASTGRVLFEQNAHEKVAPASTTKILTCLLVLENVE